MNKAILLWEGSKVTPLHERSVPIPQSKFDTRYQYTFELNVEQYFYVNVISSLIQKINLSEAIQSIMTPIIQNVIEEAVNFYLSSEEIILPIDKAQALLYLTYYYIGEHVNEYVEFEARMANEMKRLCAEKYDEVKEHLFRIVILYGTDLLEYILREYEHLVAPKLASIFIEALEEFPVETTEEITQFCDLDDDEKDEVRQVLLAYLLGIDMNVERRGES